MVINSSVCIMLVTRSVSSLQIPGCGHVRSAQQAFSIDRPPWNCLYISHLVPPGPGFLFSTRLMSPEILLRLVCPQCFRALVKIPRVLGPSQSLGVLHLFSGLVSWICSHSVGAISPFCPVIFVPYLVLGLPRALWGPDGVILPMRLWVSMAGINFRESIPP